LWFYVPGGPEDTFYVAYAPPGVVGICTLGEYREGEGIPEDFVNRLPKRLQGKRANREPTATNHEKAAK
jgi:hypothetical protein